MGGQAVQHQRRGQGVGQQALVQLVGHQGRQALGFFRLLPHAGKHVCIHRRTTGQGLGGVWFPHKGGRRAGRVGHGLGLLQHGGGGGVGGRGAQHHGQAQQGAPLHQAAGHVVGGISHETQGLAVPAAPMLCQGL